MLIDKTGIYLITCIVSQNHYVGSTAQSFRERWSQHRGELRRGCHPNLHLQNAWNKYWETSFIFEVLEVVDTLDYLIRQEQYWIDALQPEYNIGLSAVNPMLGRHHTEATKQKDREAHLGKRHTQESKDKLSRSIQGHPNYLKSHSEEAKRKISAGLKGRPVSEETRMKISESNKRRWAERKGIVEVNG